MKIGKLITFICIFTIANNAFSQGSLHVKGKIKADSLANSGYLIIIADSLGTLDTLPPGQAGQVLISNGPAGKPYWSDLSTSKILYSEVNTVSNISDTSEQVLASYLLPGNTLTTDGDWIEVKAFGKFIGPINLSSFIKLKLDGDTLAYMFMPTSVPSGNEHFFFMEANVYRRNNNSQKSQQSFEIESMLIANFYVYEQFKNLANNLNIEFTAKNGNGLGNTIVLYGFSVQLFR